MRRVFPSVMASQSAISLRTSVSDRVVSLKPGVSISMMRRPPWLNGYVPTSDVPVVVSVYSQCCQLVVRSGLLTGSEFMPYYNVLVIGC
jgi:hypothetical protein